MRYDTNCMCYGTFCCAWLFVTPWTAAHQPPLSMGFSRHEYQSGLPFPSPGDLPYQGVKPTSLMSPAVAGGFFTASATWEAPHYCSKMWVSLKSWMLTNVVNKLKISWIVRFIVTGMSAALTSLLCQLIDKFGFDIDTSPVGEYHRVRVLWSV